MPYLAIISDLTTTVACEATELPAWILAFPVSSVSTDYRLYCLENWILKSSD